MNILASITPDQATSTFNAWVAAILEMVTTLSVAAAVVLPKIAALTAQVKTLFDLHGQNSAAITTLAINTPAPAPPVADAPASNPQ